MNQRTNCHCNKSWHPNRMYSKQTCLRNIEPTTCRSFKLKRIKKLRVWIWPFCKLFSIIKVPTNRAIMYKCAYDSTFIILANSMCLSIKTHGPTRGIANTNFNTVKRETNDESREDRTRCLVDPMCSSLQGYRNFKRLVTRSKMAVGVPQYLYREITYVCQWTIKGLPNIFMFEKNWCRKWISDWSPL
jgi:hypothetical protein